MNKKIKYLVEILGIGILLIHFTSCENLSEVNTSPNDLNADDINIKYVMTSVLSGSANNYIRGQFYGGGNGIAEAMQYLQRDYIDYSVNNFTWNSMEFSSYYSSLKNAQFIYDNSKNEKSADNQKFYKAVGLIMRSFWYGFFTSAWGDIPFSEAMQAEKGNFTPKYDAQKEVFVGLLNDLKTANELLASVTNTKVEGAFSADIMYQGDVLKWRKFANSLRLRYLIRLSEKINEMKSGGVDVVAEFKKICTNNLYNPVFTSNGDNAAISFIGTEPGNSWYGGPLAFPIRSEFYRRKPCATFVNQLRDNYDPRLTVLIRPVDVQLQVRNNAPEYVKLPNGLIKRYISTSTAAILHPDTFRYVGLPPALKDPSCWNLYRATDLPLISTLDPKIYIDQAANPHVSYLADCYAQDVHPIVKAVYMSYAEVNFILAEARLKNWFTRKEDFEYYIEGVLASTKQYNIVDGSYSVYDRQSHGLMKFSVTGFSNNLKTRFLSQTDEAGKLQLIMTQKWLALWLTPEFWFDWRRTGMPDFGSNLLSGSNGNKIPMRYIYGNNEKKFNGENVSKAISGLLPAEDTQWSKMWLVQGTNCSW